MTIDALKAFPEFAALLTTDAINEIIIVASDRLAVIDVL